MPVATGAAGEGGARALGEGRGRRLSEESCLGPQLRDKERQVIKERFKVSWEPVPSPAAAAAGATPQRLSPGPFSSPLVVAGLQ